MLNLTHHIKGILLAALAAFEGWFGWFLHNIQAINNIMQFAVYAIAIATGLIGLRKVLRK